MNLALRHFLIANAAPVANTYTGGTTITNGTLQFGRTDSMSATGAVAVQTGATLAVNAGGTGQFTNATSGAGSIGGLLAGTGGQGAAVTYAGDVKLGIDTTNAVGSSLTYSGVIGDVGTTLGLTKLGTGSLDLDQSNTFTGATTVSAGTLFVSGALSSSAVTVQATGTIGRNAATNGGLGNGLTIEAGGNLDLTGATLGSSSTGILGLSAGSLTLGNLTFQDLVGWDWLNADAGTYELIEGGFSVDFGATASFSEATAYNFGNGKKGYFTSGSLNAVIVAIPEPRAALLGGLGLLALLRRRRN